MDCKECGWPLSWFGAIGQADVMECSRCDKAWYLYDNGTTEEVVGWKKYVAR